MTPTTSYFVKGTLANPQILARSRWPPPARLNDPPHTVYDPVLDGWKASTLVGGWIMNGDLRLDEIHASDVDAVKALLRARYAAAGLLPRLGRDIAKAWGVDIDLVVGA